MSLPVTDDAYIEQVARAIEAELCRDAQRHPGAIWSSERGRQQMMIAARAAAAVPRPDHLVARDEVLEAGEALYYALGVAVHQRVDATQAQAARQAWRSAVEIEGGGV
jgi:hypothetical protein